MVINEATECRVCKGKVTCVANFGSIHINDFPKKPNSSKGEAPMVLDRCEKCGLVQMRHTVDPKILYGDHYWYESALNPKLKQNFLLMHAMGPNVAGVIGSAVAAGIMIKLLA